MIFGQFLSFGKIVNVFCEIINFGKLTFREKKQNNNSKTLKRSKWFLIDLTQYQLLFHFKNSNIPLLVISSKLHTKKVPSSNFTCIVRWWNFKITLNFCSFTRFFLIYFFPPKNYLCLHHYYIILLFCCTKDFLTYEILSYPFIVSVFFPKK